MHQVSLGAHLRAQGPGNAHSQNPSNAFTILSVSLSIGLFSLMQSCTLSLSFFYHYIHYRIFSSPAHFHNISTTSQNILPNNLAYTFPHIAYIAYALTPHFVSFPIPSILLNFSTCTALILNFSFFYYHTLLLRLTCSNVRILYSSNSKFLCSLWPLLNLLLSYLEKLYL